jgi:F0F1-type ATP synthase assembly protein I
VTVVFPTPPLKLITAIDLGLMAGFVWILLKYKLKHIVAVSRSRDRPRKARAAN